MPLASRSQALPRGALNPSPMLRRDMPHRMQMICGGNRKRMAARRSISELMPRFGLDLVCGRGRDIAGALGSRRPRDRQPCVFLVIHGEALAG